MPNNLAYLMLIIWPVVMVFLFRKLPADRALIWSLITAYLILPPPPAAFDFPLMPPLSKDSIPNFAALVICMFMYGKGVITLPRSILARICIGLYVIGPIFTVFTNGEPIFFKNGDVLPGLKLSDALALSINQALLLIPFLLARELLAKPEAQRQLLLALFLCGLAYSLPMLLEVRLSPQLNLWVYGYFQHSFEQAIRAGGFRPVVFLNHGLWVSFFAMTAVASAFALWRSDKTQKRSLYFLAGGYLMVVLILAKSLGALLFALFLIPLILILSRRLQITLALVLTLLALSYPILQSADLFPADNLVAQANKVNDNRGASLNFRFYNEDILMERAREKPLFGWGSWGRNHIHDPANGTILSVTDGRWIILMGVYGIIGFIAEFGLLCLPLILLWATMRKLPTGSLSNYAAPLALILAVNVIDLIPNATLTPITWIISGALLGYAERLERDTPKRGIKGLRWKPLM